MTPTSPELERLLAHLSGKRRLDELVYREPPGGGAGSGRREGGLIERRHPRVHIDFLRMPRAEDFIDSFGKREFFAGICFIDMQGFSDLARDKSPSEVRALVAPFLESVVRAATVLKCFIDKTIGDEVMLVMPFTGLLSYHDPLECAE